VLRLRTAAGFVLSLACASAGAAAASGGSSGWRVTELPVAAHAASSFSEPGIAVGPGGRMVANACTANAGGPSTFWLSHDSGKTWGTGFPVGTSAIGCGDSDAVFGSDGWVYSLTLGTGVDVYRSRDGKHWQGPASFPPPHGTDQPDRPWLVTIPRHPDQVLMLNSEVGGNVVAWRSTDHAKTFAGPYPVTGSANSEAGLMLGSRPLVDPIGGLHMFYETVGAAGLTQPFGASGPSQFPLSQLWEATSGDGGRTWTNSQVLDVTTAFGVDTGSIGHLLPATAVDRAGGFYVVLSARLGDRTQTHLYLIHSARVGGWSKPVRIDHGVASNVFPAIAVAAPGHLFVSWYASAARDFNSSDARWFESFASSTDALSAHPHFSQTRLGDDVPVHVGPVDNMGNVGSNLGQDWGLRDFQSLVVDECGYPHVTWARDYKGTRTFTATTSSCRSTGS
jgi:hypothetical protein